MDRLKALGIDENTLVIFTSDNGSRVQGEGGSNDPCRGTKQETWEGGQRVPCIMRWPEKISPGTQSDAVVSAMDFFPTLSRLTNVSLPADRIIDGFDIGELITGENAEAPNDTFFYYKQNTLEAVRVGDWKLHFQKAGVAMKGLYNLREDISESQNRYEEHPQIVSMLEAKAERIREDIGDEATGTTGRNNRSIGRVKNAQLLTEYREDHPYMIAMYDLPDMPTMSG